MTVENGMVSVVIPCRDEVKSIRKTIDAILLSHYSNLEIIVVDGMSNDGTREILHQLAGEEPRVRMIDNVKLFTPYAFNIGIREARGEFIQIVGSRNVLDPQYIELLVAKLNARKDVACVGGDYQHVADNKTGRLISLSMESKFGVGPSNYRTMKKDCLVDTVGVPMYRKSIFQQVGMFDEALVRNQDDDFNFRLRLLGLKIMYVHAAKTNYLVRGEWRKAYSQLSQYGYFKVFVNRKHKSVTTWRQLVPPAFVAFLVLGLPLTLFFGPARDLFLLTMFIYMSTGILMAGKKLTLWDRGQVMLGCFVLHMGYGIGYWIGIWDFIIFGLRPRESFQRQTT